MFGMMAVACGKGKATLAGAADGYDLAAALTEIRALHADWAVLAEPTAPTTTSTHNVTTAAELTTALGVAGALINVAAGTYVLSMTVNAANIKMVCNASTVIAPSGVTAINFNSGCDKFEMVNGRIEGGIYGNAGANDIRLTNVTVVTKDTSADGNTLEFTSCSKVLLEHCDITSVRYALYNNSCTDLIIANSILRHTAGIPTGQSTCRTVTGTRVAVIDSRLTNPTHHCLRAHVDSDLVYWGRNQTEGAGHLYASDNPSGGLNVNRIWAVGNYMYKNSANNLFGFDSPPEVLVAVLTGNRAFTDLDGAVPGTLSPPGSDPAWTVSDNTKVAYQSPPAWDFQ